jgi:Ca2+-transporting ATPase
MTMGPTRGKEGDPAVAWSQSAARVLADLEVDPLLGLTSSAVAIRRRRFGPNLLQAAKRRSVLSIMADQFKSVVILLLLVAGVVAFLFADFAEGLAIFAVIAINGSLGFVTEWRAIRSMEALRRLGSVKTVVMRDGNVQEIPAGQLVPGDIVVLEGGDIVTADMRLIEAAKLQADESTLTGESLPVDKQTDSLPQETPVMERSNSAFKGTAITRGSGKGVVVETGMSTELGRISRLVTEAEAQQTPLEKRLDALGRRLAWAVLAIGLFIAVISILLGRDTLLSIEVGIALAVAAIPEGLPIVATIALARGMWRMAKRNALVARLSAVETLGATSVILTDKTGTLTENRMTVTRVHLPGDLEVVLEGHGEAVPSRFAVKDGRLDRNSAQLLDELLTTVALCSNASLRVGPGGDEISVGDPTEVALLVAANRRGLTRDKLLTRWPEIHEIAFDPASKRMATIHSADSAFRIAVKGAPETVIPLCRSILTGDGEVPLGDHNRQQWLDHAHELAHRGLRTLAVAKKLSTDEAEDPYRELVLLGVAGLEDPAREGVSEAIDRCRNAGVSVVMVTGDHAATARNIGTELGMVDSSADTRQFVNGAELDELLEGPATEDLLAAKVFSRVSPEQKLNLIDFYQEQGSVVAMTGDGVNDAPALKKADIGIAMGIRGTAVAKQASAMVLEDDEFRTIVEAIAHGRAIFQNIRKFVVYLLSCNISEVLIVTLATVAGAPLPLLPLQILFLNLVTDVFPALALGVGPGSGRLMQRRPRPSDEPVLTRSHWLRIAVHGIVISAAVLAAMGVAMLYLEYDATNAVTVSFCTLALAQLWHVFNMREDPRRFVINEVTRNTWVWIAIGICLALILMAVYMPFLRGLLELTDPGTQGWVLIILASFTPLLLGPVVQHLAIRDKHD